MPAIPLIVTFLLRKRIPITFVVSIIVATTLLCFWHHDYDLASDAQAALALIFIPIYVAAITSVIAAVVAAFVAVVKLLIRKMYDIANNELQATE